MTQATLFRERKPAAKPAGVPARVVRELIDVYGLDPRAVAAMPARVAFARLYALRRKAMALTSAERSAALLAMAERLQELAADDESASAELTDLILESLCLIDRGPLVRVASGLANLLTECAA